VDMSANRWKNIYGIVMRYILVIKDHFSGFVIADCIPRKHAKYVAYILNQYFSVNGFPLIFHTDNGKEFTAKSILEFLKNRSPSQLQLLGDLDHLETKVLLNVQTEL
jgi:transposase InsO family protein